MLASFSQFIRDTGNNITPTISQRFASATSAPQSKAQPETDIASTTTSITDHEHDAESSGKQAESEAKERRRKDKRTTTIYETFIVVRPPPSMSNHPLNLQLQLVPPTTRDARQNSINRSSAEADGQSLSRQRSPSMRSNRSQTSLYSSASLSTTSLASSASSTQRRIIPLYNLSAHNVITNTITDAGTDAKIAKFGKRGIEVIGLGILECYEIIGVAIDPQALALHRLASNGSLSHLPHEMPTVPEGTPARSTPSITPSSSTSHITQDSATPVPSTPSYPGVAPSTPTPNSAKKLFGKMFKRKDVSSPAMTASPSTPTPSTPTQLGFSAATPATPASPSFFRSKRSAAISGSSTMADLQSAKTSAAPTNDPTNAIGSMQPPVLGTNATLLYRTPSKSTIIAPSVIATLSGGQAGLALQATRSKGSLHVDDLPARSREPSVSGHFVASSETHPPPPEIHLEGVASGSCSPTMSFKRTSHSYEWVMRRWIKGADNGLFGIKESILSAKSAVFAGLDIPEDGSRNDGIMEVRFEWVKGKGSREREREKANQRARMEYDDAESTAGEGSRPPRRERPKSMVGRDASDMGVDAAARPTSMFVAGNGAPATPEKRLQKRKSLTSANASPATYISATTEGTNRSPSPGVRPSMDSLRRESDGSGEQAASSADHTTGGVASEVYKGQKKARRRQSVSLREGRPDVRAESDGEDSDPEDSETPWTCTLYVGPASKPDIVSGRNGISGSKSAGALGGEVPGHGRYPTSASAQFPSTTKGMTVGDHRKTVSAQEGGSPPAKCVKIKLATMTPAPHHPKVVSYVKMPFPIPDVNVDQVELVKDGSIKGNDLILTMEEIKDVVCVTGLWLVVREGFGGLERRRRGDGWKIRG